MACKRSPVRSRYSPPDIDRNGSCGLFCLYSLFCGRIWNPPLRYAGCAQMAGRWQASAPTAKICKYFQFLQKTCLTWHVSSAILNKLSRKTRTSGGLAQLGERLHGMQEVTGSIPVFSTRYRPQRKLRSFLFVFPVLRADMESAPTICRVCADGGPMASIGPYSENLQIFSIFAKNMLDMARVVCYTK